MRVHKNRKYAVLTGDIVGSTRLSLANRKLLQRSVPKAGGIVCKAFPKQCPLKLVAFRGDGWQLLFTAPAFALRGALLMRAALRMLMDGDQVDTRVSIGVGTIDFIPGEKLGEGDGLAFQLSGRGLEELGKRKRLSWSADPKEHSGFLQSTVTLLDACAQRWTASQCRAVVGALQDWTQDQIAEKWKPKRISQQAVAQHLDRASWHAVEEALTVFESPETGLAS